MGWARVAGLLTALAHVRSFSSRPDTECDPSTLFDKHAIPVADTNECMALLNALRHVARSNESADLAEYVASTWRWRDPIVRDVSTLVQPVVWLIKFPSDLATISLSDVSVRTEVLAHPLIPAGPNNITIDQKPPYKPGSSAYLWSRAKNVSASEIEGHTWLTWTFMHAPSGVDPSKTVVYRAEFFNIILDGQGKNKGHRLQAVRAPWHAERCVASSILDRFALPDSSNHIGPPCM